MSSILCKCYGLRGADKKIYDFMSKLTEDAFIEIDEPHLGYYYVGCKFTKKKNGKSRPVYTVFYTNSHEDRSIRYFIKCYNLPTLKEVLRKVITL